jgi:hypothetical protein
MKDTADKGMAESTDYKGFGSGSTAGIPASMPAGSYIANTQGNQASFSGGKKSVSK